MDGGEDEEALLAQLLEDADAEVGISTGTGEAGTPSSRVVGEPATDGAASTHSGTHQPATSGSQTHGSGQRQGTAMRLAVDVPPLLYPVWADGVGASLTGAATEAVSGLYHSAAAVAASVADYLEQRVAGGGSQSLPRRTIPPGWNPTLRQVNLFKARRTRSSAPAAGLGPPPSSSAEAGTRLRRRGPDGIKAGRWTQGETETMLQLLMCDFSEEDWPHGSDGRDVVRRRHMKPAARALGRKLQACMDRYRQVCALGWKRGTPVPDRRERSATSVKTFHLLASMAMFPGRIATANELLRAVEVQPHVMEGVDVDAPGRSLADKSKLWQQRARDSLARSAHVSSLGVLHHRSLVYRLEESYVPVPVPAGSQRAAQEAIRELAAAEGGLAAHSPTVLEAGERARRSADAEDAELDRILSDDGEGDDG